ncbi:MAG TPA: FkbM family methyltransferase [Methylomirabilota bacterium]|nr:FkbM family methyltransferase [Methylomirabilota bacterium]
MPTRVWRGPFRGARIVMNPRHSLRKVFGLYEHELNGWLEVAFGRIDRVIDVGANDGYFTFGCVAALRRHGRRGKIVAFEPEKRPVQELRESLRAQKENAAQVEIVQAFVGREVKPDMTTLDALGSEWPRTNTLIKVDVEGAELEVIAGAQSWLHASNAFVIEVHHRSFLKPLQNTFSQHGLRLNQVNQRALPLLGRENRDEENWWLVSDLSGPAQ